MRTHLPSLAPPAGHWPTRSRQERARTIAKSLYDAVFCTVFVCLCVQVSSADTVFLDTFDDGDVQDDMPVSWIPQSGIWDAASGDYVSTGNGVRISLASGHDLGDTSVRAGVRIDGDASQTIALGLGVRRSPGLFGYAADIDSAGTIVLARVDGKPMPITLATTVVPFETVGQDLLLQVDAIGDELSMWVWPADDPMPTDPLIVATDSMYASGSVGVLGLSFDSIHDATFRFVHVAGTHIPEPSSYMLAVVCGGLLLAAKRQRNRTKRSRRPFILIAMGGFACVVPLHPFAHAEDGTPPEEAQLLATDQRWSAATAAGKKDQILSYWTDDAVLYSPGIPLVAGKDAIRRVVHKNRLKFGFSLTWKAKYASVSRSAEFDYTHGLFEMTIPDRNQTPVVKRGYYVCIWKRQEDDSWKCVLEMSNVTEE